MIVQLYIHDTKKYILPSIKKVEENVYRLYHDGMIEINKKGETWYFTVREILGTCKYDIVVDGKHILSDIGGIEKNKLGYCGIYKSNENLMLENDIDNIIENIIKKGEIKFGSN